MCVVINETWKLNEDIVNTLPLSVTIDTRELYDNGYQMKIVPLGATNETRKLMETYFAHFRIVS